MTEHNPIDHDVVELERRARELLPKRDLTMSVVALVAWVSVCLSIPKSIS